MASQRVPLLTPEEYLALESKADFRSEYWDGEVYPVQAATPNHALITANVVGILYAQLRGKSCNVYASSLLVKASTTFTYPDVAVTCGDESFAERAALLNPILIVEVLSPTTKDYDRSSKFRAYRKIPSLQEYLAVSQDEMLIEQYVLQNKQWLLTDQRDPLSAFVLPSLALELRVADVYEKVQWPQEQPD